MAGGRGVAWCGVAWCGVACCVTGDEGYSMSEVTVGKITFRGRATLGTPDACRPI